MGEKDYSKYKFLWHSVAGSVRSGYGNLTRQIPSRLVAKGFQIFVSAYYGLDPGGVILINGVPHLPSKVGRFGEHSCIRHFQSLKCNAAILTTDFWAFGWFPQKLPYTILHSPMDHINYNEGLMNMVREYNQVISICKWQKKELKRRGIESRYIPHGVDTNVFQPVDKKKAREITRFPNDKYIVLWLAANSDKEPRKGWTEGFQAIKYFLEQNPDAKKDFMVFCHTNPTDERGFNLIALRDYLGLNEIVHFESPFLSQVGLRDMEIGLLYNSADILLNPSRREGFGIPILESMSCGTPVIGTNFSSMIELIKGRGWLAKTRAMVITPIMAETAIPDPYSIADCLEDAYNYPKKSIKYRKKCIAFAKNYDWNKVIEKRWVPFLESVIEDIRPKSLDERKII